MSTFANKKTARLLAVTATASAALLTFTACAPPGGATDSPGSSDEGDAQSSEIRVGFIAPITGNFAVAGQEMVDGWELYWELNGAEVNGVTVTTIVEDDAGKPDISLTKARKLVESDNVDVLVGPLLANTALAVAAYSSGVGIPNLHPVAAADDLTQREGNDLTMRTGSMGSSQMNYPGGIWAAEQGYETAVTLCPDYAFGWESCAGFLQGFEENGGEVIAQHWYPNGTTDFATYVSQVQAAGADVAFLVTAGGAPGANLLRSYIGLGLDKTQPMLTNCCALDQATLRTLGDQVLGMHSVSYWAEGRDSDLVREFNEAYAAHNEGQLPSVNVAGGYLTASMFANAIQEHGALTGADLISAITDYSFDDSIYGKLSFDDYNSLTGPVYIREVHEVDGQLMNVPVAEYPEVDQWLGKDPETVLGGEPYSQSNQGRN